MVDIFCPWFSKKYLLAASGFAVSVCRGGEDKFVKCPRNISTVMRKHGTAERAEQLKAVWARRDKAKTITGLQLCEKRVEMKLKSSSLLDCISRHEVQSLLRTSDTGN